MKTRSHPSPSSQRPLANNHQDQWVCPACGAALIQEKCKVVCRSPQCVYRIVFNCSEF